MEGIWTPITPLYMHDDLRQTTCALVSFLSFPTNSDASSSTLKTWKACLAYAGPNTRSLTRDARCLIRIAGKSLWLPFWLECTTMGHFSALVCYLYIHTEGSRLIAIEMIPLSPIYFTLLQRREP